MVIVIIMDIVLSSLQEISTHLDALTETFLASLGIWGALASCLLITIESILPILPVCVFITLVFYTFGSLLGFIISWVFTCLGCLLSFSLFRSKIKKWFERKFMKKDAGKIKKFMHYIDHISVSGLAVLVAIPFTPASVVNVAAGLSNISRKKFMISIMIGKLVMVYFWGYIGTTLMECFTHPIYLVKIIVLLVGTFIVSKMVNKYFHVE